MKKNKRIFILFLLLSLFGMILLSGLLTDVSASSNQQRYNRLVIKEGTLEIMVEDTDAAVERALDIANTYNGYVLKQRVWDGEDRRYRYAEITFGMPTDDFEGLTQGLKTLGRLLDETANGQDVTDEYGDQIAHLESLYETQERMRTFLEQADTITDTFTVHDELLKIEAEIGEVQGRANYLENQAASAALTVKIVPFIPTPTPSPTLTPTPTLQLSSCKTRPNPLRMSSFTLAFSGVRGCYCLLLSATSSGVSIENLRRKKINRGGAEKRGGFLFCFFSASPRPPRLKI